MWWCELHTSSPADIPRQSSVSFQTSISLILPFNFCLPCSSWNHKSRFPSETVQIWPLSYFSLQIYLYINISKKSYMVIYYRSSFHVAKCSFLWCVWRIPLDLSSQLFTLFVTVRRSVLLPARRCFFSSYIRRRYPARLEPSAKTGDKFINWDWVPWGGQPLGRARTENSWNSVGARG